MTHAYDEVFLDDAMENLGAALEYAVLGLGLPGQDFLNLFVASGVGTAFGKGNVKLLSGMSGIELCEKVLERCGLSLEEKSTLTHVDYSMEYWIGWILAYYQWYTNRSFSIIIKKLSYDTLAILYKTLHEADMSKAVQVFDQWVLKQEETNLAVYRKNRGFSQSQLAKEADISIRSIQLYEQRQTDINRAQYNHLLALARALHCEVEDLLE